MPKRIIKEMCETLYAVNEGCVVSFYDEKPHWTSDGYDGHEVFACCGDWLTVLSPDHVYEVIMNFEITIDHEI